jgi:hypothetical protein
LYSVRGGLRPAAYKVQSRRPLRPPQTPSAFQTTSRHKVSSSGVPTEVVSRVAVQHGVRRWLRGEQQQDFHRAGILLRRALMAACCRAMPAMPCHLLAIWGWRGIAGRRASCPAASRKHDRDDDNDERVSGRPGIASASRRERQLGPHECVEWYPIATPPGPDPDRGFEQVGFPYAIAVSAPPFLRARTGSHGSRVRARRHLLRARPDEGRDSAPWRAVVPGSRPVATMATTRAASAIIIVISAVLITTIEGGVGGRPAG